MQCESMLLQHSGIVLQAACKQRAPLLSTPLPLAHSARGDGILDILIHHLLLERDES